MRIQVWSESRYDAWSHYFSTVNEYIRLVVQVDPDNRVRARLRDQLKQFPTRPYGLRLVHPQPFLHLRTVSRPASETLVTISADIIERQGLEVFTEPLPDPIDLAIEKLVKRLKRSHEIDIVAAVMEEAFGLTEEQWFILLARATPVLLQHGLPADLLISQAWFPMGERLEAQTLLLQSHPLPKKGASSDV